MTPQANTLYTAANYATVRQSWQDLIEMFGLSSYRLKRMQAAYGLWQASGPVFADGDDWVEAAQEWQHTYLANRAAA